jgi:hypothetical protein
VIKPPAEPEPELTKPIVRSVGNARTLSSKFLGDLQRQYDEKGYKVIELVYENHPLKYFLTLVALSKVVRIEADVTHRDGSKPQSIDEILDRVEAQTGPAGRAAFAKFMQKIKPS